MILYGAPVKEKIKRDLILRLKKIKSKPVLAIIQVGRRPDSSIYIDRKKKFGEEIGVSVIHKKFPTSVSEKKLILEIEKNNADKKITGLLIQLPLPPKLNTEKIIQSIDPRKDADGLKKIKNATKGNLITPATARAVTSLLDFYKIKVQNKKIAVIGRSRLAGQPIADELKKRGAKVTPCDRSMNAGKIESICRNSNILISAAGQAGLVTKEFVNSKQVVIDVGINRITHPVRLRRIDLSYLKRGKKKTTGVVGDVKFEEVAPLVKAITPVPGGIGPLTVACLFQNLLDLSK